MTSSTPRLDQVERNLIINGNMDFFQRGTTVGTGSYAADRWQSVVTGGSSGSVTQSTDVPTVAQSGFSSLYSLKYTVTSGAAIGTGQFALLSYKLEGQDYQQLHAKAGRLQKWVKCSTAGTFSVALRNPSGTRSYVTTFTVNSANTWEKKTFDFSADTTGTWAFDNTTGLIITIGLSVGSTLQTGSLKTWQNGNFLGATGQADFVSTTGATFQIAQVMLIPQDFTQAGSALVDVPFHRAGLSIGDELAKCQRYCHVVGFDNTVSGEPIGVGQCASATVAVIMKHFPVTMRSIPTIGTNTSANTSFILSNAAFGVIAITSFSFNGNTTPSYGEFSVNVASGLVAGNSVFFVKNVGGSLLVIDSEL